MPLRGISVSRSALFLIIATTFALFFTPASAAVGFQPVNPDELKMTSEPKAPGAQAVILQREVARDDSPRTAHEDDYYRVKILTEEGRKYGDIEVRFSKGEENVVNVHARTIKPDGSIVNFDGRVYEKTIVKGRGLKYLAKTFTMPEVKPGCILEYYYTIDYSDQYIGYSSHWILSEDLYTRNAKFSLKPYGSSSQPLYLRWTWNKLPEGTKDPVQAQNPPFLITMDSNDIPAFQTEDYMPPENEMKSRVDFIYSEDQFEKEPDVYWKKRGKKLNGWLEEFVNKRKAMEQAVSETVSPGDTPEVKLQKIYARVQQIRDTSLEEEKTEQEEKRAKEKNPENVEDVWKKQYAQGWQLTWLFLGMARAAGFEAYGVWVADRGHYFFSPKTMDSRRLNENVVDIKINGKDTFFDPGAAFMPFGMLPWIETGVTGLRLDKEGGSWLLTTLPASKESSIQRKAALKLTDSGDLEGDLVVTYTGLEAAERRVEEHRADDAERKKFLEDEAKGFVPAACEIELKKQPDWKSSSPSMPVEFSIKVPGWAAGAGRRSMLTIGLFSAPEKHIFDHSDRVYPIYFQFPFEREDSVDIELPLGWQIATLPAPEKYDQHVVGYTMQAENNKGTLHLTRNLNVDLLMLDTKYYPALRGFFGGVRTADEQQVILQPNTTGAGN